MASITYTIPGVRLMNQLLEPSNPRDDCVFTSNACLVNAYTGSHYTGSQIKALDSDYGAAYTGFASQAKLLDTLARLGVRFARVSHPTQAELTFELHRQIEHYHQAAIITMPSQWNSAPSTVPGYNPRTYRSYSHVGLMCGAGPGMLRCMNPWGGFWQDQSDAWWQQRLLYGEIWVGVYRPVVSAPQAAPAPSQPQPAASSTTAAPTVASLQAKIAKALADLS
ncbi:MAG TPA: hypothetical protein VFU63_00190 [Ktedonobacterales bacterium]|nr:hypothetical protein [Ktedonobacterales bacterium]